MLAGDMKRHLLLGRGMEGHWVLLCMLLCLQWLLCHWCQLVWLLAIVVWPCC